MKSDWYKKYWQIGFATHLYELLAPQAYLDCLKRSVEIVPDLKSKIILDAGCGSGLLLNYLRQVMKPCSRYIGIDKLWSGVTATSGKIGKANEEYVIVQSDLLDGLALKENTIDIVFALFLTYTIGDPGRRKKLMRNLHQIVKPGGKLILINPSENYCADNIIRVSLEECQKNNGFASWFIKKTLVYPLTLELGLKHVENQLKTQVWHAYSQEALCKEIKDGGFLITHLETTYANSAYLVMAERI